jgi:hypothetical protein
VSCSIHRESEVLHRVALVTGVGRTCWSTTPRRA